MARSGYADDGDYGATNLWRGAVTRALSGKRGQAFLKELLSALDGLPEKKLIEGSLAEEGQFCALGAVAHARGLDVSVVQKPDPDDYYGNADEMASMFGIARAMAAEIMYMNDEYLDSYIHKDVSPERRYEVVRDWVAKHIKAEK
jgi:hypothetical protein